MFLRQFGLVVALLLSRGLLQSAPAVAAQNDAEPHALMVEGAVRGVHDPAIAKEGDTYYLFASGVDRFRQGGPTAQERGPENLALRPQLPIRCSTDLLTWRRCGDVFPSIPEWIRKASPNTFELWAPDISYVNGRYLLYYAYSILGKTTSGIALATNEALDPSSPRYKWVDQGLVLRSVEGDDWNAIDPNLAVDEDGHKWLTYGSFWSGIKVRRMDDETGLPAKHSKVYSVAGRAHWHTGDPLDPTAEEGPFVFTHDGWYYLFVSWDLCCRGAQSTYREMVGRSRKITGPYKDRDGKAMRDGGGTEVLEGNGVWVGPGGASFVHDGDRDLVVFHAYSKVDGRPSLQISTIAWKDGWPEAAVSEVER